MKTKVIMSVCDCFKRVGKPKFKNDSVTGTITYDLSMSTLKEGADILSEDEVLKIIGGRIIELIRTGV